ncbi:sialate O-acetylesterase [Methyloligella halotolerans]|uniref:sialate O-acetylesterase n=1 Tax=Methyloligella halotolerans TaxID=1177755 RepID=UPI001FD8B8C1|nr:sialate O-acetylesterase [Methyloligella halotolerans]
MLLSGQSNALGLREGGPRFADCDDRVQVWNNFNPYGSYGYDWVYPQEARPPFHLTGPSNNLGVWFAHCAAQRLRQDVRLTVVANPDASMVEWLPEVGTMSRTIDAVFEAQGSAPYDVMLWHQGEADRGCDTGWYREALDWLVASLREKRILKRNGPVLLGGLASPLDACVNCALVEAAQDHMLMRFVDVGGIPAEGGLEHFSGAGLAELGQRYFEAYHPRGAKTRGFRSTQNAADRI